MIDGRTFAVMAAFTVYGCIAWKLYDGTVSDAEISVVIRNLTNNPPKFFPGNSIGLLDNASNQRTEYLNQFLKLIYIF